jgi:hypothetical protein
MAVFSLYSRAHSFTTRQYDAAVIYSGGAWFSGFLGFTSFLPGKCWDVTPVLGRICDEYNEYTECHHCIG